MLQPIYLRKSLNFAILRDQVAEGGVFEQGGGVLPVLWQRRRRCVWWWVLCFLLEGGVDVVAISIVSVAGQGSLQILWRP